VNTEVATSWTPDPFATRFERRGDGTLILRPERELPPFPQVDVLGLGMWVSPEKAKDFGVFVSLRNASTELSFFLQKLLAAKIRELAQAQNVFCKLSGMVTEARWQTWSAADFRPYLDVVWDAFGANRLMIGSDWPVCLLSGEYERTMGIAQRYLEQFAATEREKVLGANAVRFYRLPV